MNLVLCTVAAPLNRWHLIGFEASHCETVGFYASDARFTRLGNDSCPCRRIEWAEGPARAVHKREFVAFFLKTVHGSSSTPVRSAAVTVALRMESAASSCDILSIRDWLVRAQGATALLRMNVRIET